jgi:hypothetical protein
MYSSIRHMAAFARKHQHAVASFKMRISGEALLTVTKHTLLLLRGTFPFPVTRSCIHAAIIGGALQEGL